MLHPHPLVILKKLFNLFLMGMLEQPVSEICTQRSRQYVNNVMQTGQRKLLADINISLPIGVYQITDCSMFCIEKCKQLKCWLSF